MMKKMMSMAAACAAAVLALAAFGCSGGSSYVGVDTEPSAEAEATAKGLAPSSGGNANAGGSNGKLPWTNGSATFSDDLKFTAVAEMNGVITVEATGTLNPDAVDDGNKSWKPPKYWLPYSLAGVQGDYKTVVEKSGYNGDGEASGAVGVRYVVDDDNAAGIAESYKGKMADFVLNVYLYEKSKTIGASGQQAANQNLDSVPDGWVKKIVFDLSKLTLK